MNREKRPKSNVSRTNEQHFFLLLRSAVKRSKLLDMRTLLYFSTNNKLLWTMTFSSIADRTVTHTGCVGRVCSKVSASGYLTVQANLTDAGDGLNVWALSVHSLTFLGDIFAVCDLLDLRTPMTLLLSRKSEGNRLFGCSSCLFPGETVRFRLHAQGLWLTKFSCNSRLHFFFASSIRCGALKEHQLVIRPWRSSRINLPSVRLFVSLCI